MFSPSKHFNKLTLTNVDDGPLFGRPHVDTITLPYGGTIPSAVPGHPETVTYWLQQPDWTYGEVTRDQGFANSLWLHYLYGDPVVTSRDKIIQLLGLDQEHHISDAAFVAAVMGMPTLVGNLQALGYTEAQVLDYAHFEAPLIVGQP